MVCNVGVKHRLEVVEALGLEQTEDVHEGVEHGQREGDAVSVICPEHGEERVEDVL